MAGLFYAVIPNMYQRVSSGIPQGTQTSPKRNIISNPNPTSPSPKRKQNFLYNSFSIKGEEPYKNITLKIQVLCHSFYVACNAYKYNTFDGQQHIEWKWISSILTNLTYTI